MVKTKKYRLTLHLVEMDTDPATKIFRSDRILPFKSFRFRLRIRPNPRLQNYIFMDTVLFHFRVDKDKGYIDLSKRRVSKEDIERCTEKYSKVYWKK